MKTYVLMTKLSTMYAGKMKEHAEVGRNWLEQVKEKCPEVKFISHYALLGEYDFMDIYEAPDEETAAKVSLISRSNARFTDAGTYFFDIAMGKSFTPKKIADNIRLYMMIGFYGYQTSSNIHFQNDALLFGSGINAMIKSVSISTSLGGYRGYMDNRDKPLTYRASITKHNEHVKYRLSFQKGLNYMQYNTFRISAIVYFDRDSFRFPITTANNSN